MQPLKSTKRKRTTKAVTGLTALSALGATATMTSNAYAAPPNVVVILADDMGWSDIGCFGSEIHTPNLDKLAKEGVRFTQFYNTARCSPSRASLLTGLYPHEAGMGYLDTLTINGSEGTTGHLSDRAVTMAEALKPAGYFTAMTGKWHLGQRNGTPPWQRGFEHSLDSTWGETYFPNQQGLKDPNVYLDGQAIPIGSPKLGKDWYSSDLWTTYSLKFVDEALKEKKPFFLYQAFCAPHFPLMAPKEAIARYKGKYMEGWDKLREERHARQIKMGLVDPKWPLAPRPPASPAWDTLSPADKALFDQKMAIYAAMIDRLDKAVGDLVDGLRKRGALDNTLIVFLSDNGGNAESGPRGITEGDDLGGPDSKVFLGMNWATLANTPFRRYKHFIHEGGISAPFIAHWPKGIPKERDGSIVNQPAHLVDIMATVMDISGAKYPTTFNGHAIHPMDGVSLMPALKGQDLKRPNPIFWEHEGNRGVRQGKWKLVSKYLDPWELYDIEADRTEQHNVIQAHPEIAKDMETRWGKWAANSFVDQWKGKRREDWGDEMREAPGDVGSKATSFDLKNGADLGREQAPQIIGRDIAITAVLGVPHGNGVILAQGGAAAGYALWVRDGKLELVTRVDGKLAVATTTETLPSGPLTLKAQLNRDGSYLLQIGDQPATTGKGLGALNTMPLDGLQVGRDLAGLVGSYPKENSFDGVIDSVHIELKK